VAGRLSTMDVSNVSLRIAKRTTERARGRPGGLRGRWLGPSSDGVLVDMQKVSN